MTSFSAPILRFGEMGEKTNWMYIEIPPQAVQMLNPGGKKSFRVKGTLDNYRIEMTALLPLGNGTFILPFNARMSKATGKRDGAFLEISLEADKRKKPLNPLLIECLSDEPSALNFFRNLPKSHQGYFSKWIDSAKTERTKANRIAESIIALSLEKRFSDMLREKNGGDNYYARLKDLEPAKNGKQKRKSI